MLQFVEQVSSFVGHYLTSYFLFYLSNKFKQVENKFVRLVKSMTSDVSSSKVNRGLFDWSINTDYGLRFIKIRVENTGNVWSQNNYYTVRIKKYRNVFSKSDAKETALRIIFEIIINNRYYYRILAQIEFQVSRHHTAKRVRRNVRNIPTGFLVLRFLSELISDSVSCRVYTRRCLS